MSKSFVVRMVVWWLLIIYLALDFFVFKGPVKGEIDNMRSDSDELVAAMRAQGMVARVYGKPIYLGQVDRRLDERLWRMDQKRADLPAKQLEMWRKVVLEELIDEELMRIKVRFNQGEYPVAEEKIDQQLAYFKARFASDEEYQQALVAQGIENDEEMRYRIAAQLQQDIYLAEKISDAVAIDDELAIAWFEQNKSELAQPESRRVRHIFIAKLNKDSAVVKQRLEQVLGNIESGQIDFADAAAAVSEDAANKSRGGELGWMHEGRLPEDFAQAVFQLETGQPRLIESSLGWHIAEVVAVNPARQASYDELADEIKSNLADMRRTEAIRQYRANLRAMHPGKVVLFSFDGL
ncbi:peptidylprolyl isomerase [Persicirhabdus sediminis]|uniref:Peptidylprolyl isomerase n=1 Tax=Persicirhabdus sediminis TaxID=454144 RepID=A0A8J7SJX3_9BACT|nr:peptidylprolyl isomerase [Persicirhabdus sediminis]MBK1792450.1 peptidylprolyl isomerase [Persicirhabdus sediminis]